MSNHGQIEILTKFEEKRLLSYLHGSQAQWQHVMLQVRDEEMESRLTEI